jgi:hypothetical protein
MDNAVRFDKLVIDVVVDILKSPATVGPYRGNEVNDYLNKAIEELTENTLLIVDLRKANPLQYNFCQHAFGPLLKRIQERKEKKIFIIFSMYAHHKTCFFRGVLKYIDVDLSRRDPINSFVESGMYAMLLNDGEINYLSQLNTIEKLIIDFLSKEMHATVRTIEEANGLPTEETVYSLRALQEKGFLLHNNENSKYYSIKNFLNDADYGNKK